LLVLEAQAQYLAVQMAQTDLILVLAPLHQLAVAVVAVLKEPLEVTVALEVVRHKFLQLLVLERQIKGIAAV